jgi:hypothetical protein
VYRAPLETRVSLTLSRHSARTSESTARRGRVTGHRTPEGGGAPGGLAERGVPVRGSGGAPRVRRRRRGRRAVHPVRGPRSAAGCWVLGAARCGLRAPCAVRGAGPRET